MRRKNDKKNAGGANWSHLLPRISQTPRPSIQETLSGHGLHKSHLESKGDLRRPSRPSIQAVLHFSPRGCFKSSGTREEKELQTVNAKDLPRIQKDWISFTWYFIRFEFYRKYLSSILGNPWVHMPLITPYFRKGGYIGRYVGWPFHAASHLAKCCAPPAMCSIGRWDPTSTVSVKNMKIRKIWHWHGNNFLLYN